MALRDVATKQGIDFGGKQPVVFSAEDIIADVVGKAIDARGRHLFDKAAQRGFIGIVIADQSPDVFGVVPSANSDVIIYINRVVFDAIQDLGLRRALVQIAITNGLRQALGETDRSVLAAEDRAQALRLLSSQQRVTELVEAMREFAEM
jgi:hypothetical protein